MTNEIMRLKKEMYELQSEQSRLEMVKNVLQSIECPVNEIN